MLANFHGADPPTVADFQATNVTLLNTELGRDAKIVFPQSRYKDAKKPQEYGLR